MKKFLLTFEAFYYIYFTVILTACFGIKNQLVLLLVFIVILCVMGYHFYLILTEMKNRKQKLRDRLNSGGYFRSK